jgi:hypothetical protein
LRSSTRLGDTPPILRPKDLVLGDGIQDIKASPTLARDDLSPATKELIETLSASRAFPGLTELILSRETYVGEKCYQVIAAMPEHDIDLPSSLNSKLAPEHGLEP